MTRTLLPQLHGLASTFDDSMVQSIDMMASSDLRELQDLHELQEVCGKIQGQVGHLTGTDLSSSLHASSHNVCAQKINMSKI